MKKLSTKNAPAAIGPYSQAIRTGNLLFVSGQIPLDPETGNVCSNDIKEQTHRVFKNIGFILKEAGCDYSNVVKTTVYVNNMEDFPVVNEIYSFYFTEKPARSCVEVSRLPKDVLIETEVIAEIPNEQ